MSNITSGPSRGSDADDESRLTVEDTGSTTDAADLVGGERARRGDADLAGDGAVGSRSGGSGERVAAVAVSGSDDLPGIGRTGVGDTGGRSGVDHDHDHDHGQDYDHDHGSAQDHDHAGHDHDSAHADGAAAGGGLVSALDDGSIGHVFDQTNGVVEGLEGDSDGTADSDGLSRSERRDADPALLRDPDGAVGDTDRGTGH